jgi:hypothetical protein
MIKAPNTKRPEKNIVRGDAFLCRTFVFFVVIGAFFGVWTFGVWTFGV